MPNISELQHETIFGNIDILDGVLLGQGYTGSHAPALSLSCVWCFATPWTIARQVPFSMGSPMEKYQVWICPEYQSGLSFPSPGNFPDPGIKPASPALAGGFFTNEPCGKPLYRIRVIYNAMTKIFIRREKFTHEFWEVTNQTRRYNMHLFRPISYETKLCMYYYKMKSCLRILFCNLLFCLLLLTLAQWHYI